MNLNSSTVKSLPEMQETQVRSPGWEDPLQKEMATYSSIPAWKIPWTEEPSRLQPMRSQSQAQLRERLHKFAFRLIQV